MNWFFNESISDIRRCVALFQKYFRREVISRTQKYHYLDVLKLVIWRIARKTEDVGSRHQTCFYYLWKIVAWTVLAVHNGQLSEWWGSWFWSKPCHIWECGNKLNMVLQNFKISFHNFNNCWKMKRCTGIITYSDPLVIIMRWYSPELQCMKIFSTPQPSWLR